MWRDTARWPKIMGLDARAFSVLLLWGLRVRLWTSFLVLLSLMVAFVIQRFGYTPEIAVRAFRRWLIGKRRPSTNRSIAVYYSRVPKFDPYESLKITKKRRKDESNEK